MPKAGIFSCLKEKITGQWKSRGPVNSIFRNMILLATGTGLARVIGFISTPIITRIYLPEHMGVLSVFIALVSMLVSFGTLRYNMAIPLPKNDGSAVNLIMLCSTSLLLISTLILVFFWLFAPPVLNLLSMNQLLPYWLLLPLAVSGVGLYELLSSWAIRVKAFKPLAKTQIWQSVIGNVVKIGLGAAGVKPLGLLIGYIFTQAGGILSLLKSFFRQLKTNFRHVSRKRMTFMLKRFADFPRYRLPSQLLLVFASKTPLLFLAWHFDAEITGQFGLAMMVLLLPVNLIAGTVGDAYYSEIAAIGRNKPKEIYDVTKNITQKLFLASLLPFLILLILGPWIFSFVFGEIWREAGLFASVLAVNMLTMFVSGPITHSLNVFEKQNYYLQINIVRLILIFSAFSIAYILNLTPVMTLLLYSVALSVQRIFIYLKILHVIKAHI